MKATTDKTLARIAYRVLGIDALDTRKRDSLDFTLVGAWNIKQALAAAYRAGQQTAGRSAK